MNVPTPTNSQIFFNNLLNIAAFDFVETLSGFDERLDVLYILDINDPTTEPPPGNFEALDYESTSFTHNIGSLILLYAIYPIYVVILTLVRRLLVDKRSTYLKLTKLL